MHSRARNTTDEARPVGEDGRGTASGWRTFAPGAALLFLLVTIAYLPAFSAGFVWDDGIYITGNATLRTWSGLADIWFRPGATREYYPLVFTTFWVEYQLFGAEPWVYHATNVLVHAASACVLWRICAALRLPGAWMAAAVFALHPVHVESVAWAVERKNVLSCTFALLATLSWLRFLDQRRRVHVVLAALAFTAAMLSKPAVAPLPVVMLLVAWWRAGRIDRATAAASTPLFGVALVLGALHVVLEQGNLASTLVVVDDAPAERALAAGRAAWFYAGKLLFPYPLVTHYARWDVMASPLVHAALLAAAIAVPILLWTLRERIGRAPFVAVASYLALLAPASGLVSFAYLRFAFVADHLQYVPSIALTTLFVAAAAERCPPAARKWAAVLVLALLGLLTYRQSALYESNARLFEHNLRHEPDAWGAHDQLGAEALKSRDFATAARHFEASLRTHPENDVALANLGLALAGLGHDAEARAMLQRALVRQPDQHALRVNLATILERQGELASAAAEYERVLSRDPRSITALNNLALLRERAGRLDEALELLRRARSLRPDVSAIEENLRRIEGLVRDRK